MFCPNCGKKIPDQSQFCPECGTGLPTRSNLEPRPAPKPEPKPEPGDGDSRDSKKPAGRGSIGTIPTPVKLGLTAAVVVIVAVVAVAIFSVSNAKPQLTDEQIKQSIPGGETLNVSLGELWEKTDECKLASVVSDNIRDGDEKGLPHRSVEVTATFEGSLVKATCTYTPYFVLKDGAWELEVCDQTGYKVEPIAAIPEELLTSCASSLMKTVDTNHPYKDADGKTLKLQELYANGFNCSITENETAQGAGGTIKMAISAQKGIRSYSGTLKATFGWDNNGWTVTDCTADEGSYGSSIDSFVGTWTGELLEAKRSTSYTCYGGRANPPVLTVKSVDSSAQTAVVDLTYTVHPHECDGSDIDTSADDVQVTQSNLLLSIKESFSAYKIYSGKNPVNHYVEFKITSDGLVKLYVETSGGLGVWQNDTYKLSKKAAA